MQARAERVAVLYFLNSIPPQQMSAADVGFFQSDPQYGYLERALADMVITDLARSRCVGLVERAKIERFMDEVHLDASGAVDPATAQHAGHALSAAHLIHGYVRMESGTLVVTPYIDSPPWSTTQNLASVKGAEADLFGLEDRLMQTLRARLCAGGEMSTAEPRIPSGATLAILPFTDNSKVPIDVSLQKAFSDIVMARLAALDRFRLVERGRLDEIYKEIRLQHSGAVDEQSALQVGHLVGAQYILFGSFLRVGKTLRMDVRISAVEKTRTPYYWEIHGPLHDISALAVRLVDLIAYDINRRE